MESGSKVAIPRLSRHEADRKDTEKHRVDKACTNCRRRKVKCNGAAPCCQHCESQDAQCVYPQARKDRLKSATDQNAQLIGLLKDLKLRVNESDQQKIVQVLDTTEDDDVQPPTPTSALGKRPRRENIADLDDDDDQDHGEAATAGSAGSNSDVDLLDENLLRNDDSKATGFMGQNSEVQWLRSLKTHFERQESGDSLDQQKHGPPGTSHEAASRRSDNTHERRDTHRTDIPRVADLNFYLDSEDFDTDISVDQHLMPSPDTADRLFQAYMETVHTSFPLVPSVCVDHFRKYCEYAKQGKPYHLTTKWQALLNLIFAIGARYSHLIMADWQGEEHDHLVYMARAVRLLGLKNVTMAFDPPDLPQIHATGLLSLYYLTIGHVSRAWIMIGISLRFALAVGLHVRNEDPDASINWKENLRRTFWSLQAIECLLSSITGRPSVISQDDCTVSQPEAVPAGSNSDSQPESVQSSDQAFIPFFNARTRIGIITQRASSELYSPRTAAGSWERLQKTIEKLSKELNEWALAVIPDEINPFVDSHPRGDGATDPSVEREKLLLSFSYYSTTMVLTRPCLCRLEQRIKNQSARSADFNNDKAKACVKAALQLTNLLPDHPDPTYLYKQGPWWSIIHDLVQATAVLMLEVAHGSVHKPSRDDDIPGYVKKLMRWLRSLGSTNSIAERAYKVVMDVLSRKTSGIPDDIKHDILHEAGDTSQNQPPRSSRRGLQGNHHGDCLDGFMDQDMGSGEQSQFAIPMATQGSMMAHFGDPYYVHGGEIQFAPTFGNPFLTSFDQQNRLMRNTGDMWLKPNPSVQDPGDGLSDPSGLSQRQ